MIRARKRFGQHFLRDTNTIARIVSAIKLNQSDHCLEIGPGEGVLTHHLQPQCKQLTAVEIDRDLVALLQRKFFDAENFTLIEADVLTIDITTIAKNEQLRIVGNLPYNISTPLLFHLCESRQYIQDMVFMLQKEVVDRMSATPGNKTYGRLSVMIQYYCEVTSLFTVGPHAFSPPPKVESAIVHLIPHQQSPYPSVDEHRFETIVRAAFAHRRKTLANCLKGLLTPEQISSAGIDPQTRAEQLSVEDFVRLARVECNLHS